MDTRSKILDIAMNLNRIGNWAADDFHSKEKRIKTFMGLTTQSIQKVEYSAFNETFKNTFERFRREYQVLEKEGLEGPKDTLYWSEKMMTWGNILTLRSKLIASG